MSTEIADVAGVQLTQFSKGAGRGAGLQLTVQTGLTYTQLDELDARELGTALLAWSIRELPTSPAQLELSPGSDAWAVILVASGALGAAALEARDRGWHSAENLGRLSQQLAQLAGASFSPGALPGI